MLMTCVEHSNVTVVYDSQYYDDRCPMCMSEEGYTILNRMYKACRNNLSIIEAQVIELERKLNDLTSS